MKRYFFQDMNPDVVGGNLETIRYAAELNRLRPIIDSVYRLEEYPAAIERFEQRNGVKYGKVVLKVTDDADEIKPPV
jgi:NADPH:quinone reductase-like Zn-dependent oxidoreductase